VRWMLAVPAFALSCGGGMDEPPVCPTGDCTLPGRTIVKYTFNHHPEMMFEGDTCLDLGAVNVRAEVTGIDDPAFHDAKELPCGQGQVSFLGLPVGNYTIAITPLDGAGLAIVKAPVTAQAVAGVPGADTEVTINVPFDAWTGSYAGTFLFRLSWGGASCDDAAPPIKHQVLTLTAGGTVVTTATTDKGQKLDGSDPQPCRALSEAFAQFAPEMPQTQPGLPFGPATLHVIGTDASGEVRFDHEFDTFVGAAKNNPTIVFDVPAPPPPDAGVDAPPADAAIDAM
jgi:hypothetical protein